MKKERIVRRKRRIDASSFYDKYKGNEDLFIEGPGWCYSFAYDVKQKRIHFHDWVMGQSYSLEAGDIISVEINKNHNTVWFNEDKPASGSDIVNELNDDNGMMFAFPELTDSIEVKISYIQRNPEGNKQQEIIIPCFRYERDIREYVKLKQRYRAASILEKAVKAAAKIGLIVDIYILSDYNGSTDKEGNHPFIPLDFCPN